MLPPLNPQGVFFLTLGKAFWFFNPNYAGRTEESRFFPGYIQFFLQKSGLHFPFSGVGLGHGLLFPKGCQSFKTAEMIGNFEPQPVQ